MNSNTETIEYFYGVYLLYCQNPQYKGRTYIGFTVDPNRRIKQHNKGKNFGGAWRTSNKGPWKMVLIIHGFPNDITALRFEWAWQHPNLSRRLKHVGNKKRFEKSYDFCLRVLSEMLRVGPWNRLPLTIRWLEDEFSKDFPADKVPPVHMPICFGPVVSKKLKKVVDEAPIQEKNYCTDICFICKKIIDNRKGLDCLFPNCNMKCHIVCLSKKFLTIGEYIPISGNCPKCKEYLLWGDLIRKYRGCFDNNGIANPQDFSDSSSDE